jgi:hypothetical protein
MSHQFDGMRFGEFVEWIEEKMAYKSISKQ